MRLSLSVLLLCAAWGCSGDKSSSDTGNDDGTTGDDGGGDPVVPTIGGVELSPTTAFEDTVFTCTPVDLANTDDATAFAFTWSVNGTALSTTEDSLTGADFNKGDTVSCAVVATAGDLSSDPTSSNEVTVSNSPPVVDTITVRPDMAYTNDYLQVTAVGATDLDGDTITYAISWLVDGVEIGQTSDVLDGAMFFSRDQLVQVMVTPNDGTEDGVSIINEGTTISNTPPTYPSVYVGPEAPVEGADDLTCILAMGSWDADEDMVSYEATWTVDGVAYTGPTSSISIPGDTIPAANLVAGQEWSCTILATDGTDATVSAPSSTIVDEPVTIEYYGETTTLATAGYFPTGYLYAAPVTLPAGDLWEIGFIADPSNTSNAVFGLYTDNGGAPGTLVGQTGESLPVTDTKIPVVGAPIAISAGTYWIVGINSTNLQTYQTTTGSCASTPLIYAGVAYNTTLPSSYPSGYASLNTCVNLYVGVD